MALAAHLKTLEGVDENISALYKQNEAGGFILDVTDTTTDSGAAYGLGDYGGLKSALSSERGISSQYKADLAKYSGIDIEEANSAIEFKTKYTGKTSDDLDARVAELQKGYDDKLSIANAATQEAIAAKNDFQLGHVVDAAIMGRDDLNPSMSKWFRGELLNNVSIGDAGVFVKDANGNPRMSAEASNTGNMSVAELIGTMSNDEQFGGFFKAQGAGSGSGNSSNSGAPNTGGKLSSEQFRALSEGEKNKAYASDPEHYKTML